jgi:CDP-6-deoxy-D-xylo-4-hexulose-3-dehydrase
MYKIPLIKRPFFQESTVKRKLASFVRTSEIFSMNKLCIQFEKEFSTYQGRKYTVLFNSGSSANFALIQALVNLKRVSAKDIMGFCSIGWPTTVTPALQLGIETAPIDIDLRYLNSTVEQIETTQKTLKEKYGTSLSLIFYTNILGGTGDIKEIAEYCKKNKIMLLEDNCESLGSEYKGTKLGNFGLASTFSFFIGHHFSCIEGGAVCTDDKELAEMLIMVRAHGWDRNLSETRQKELRAQADVDEFNAKYTFYTIGMNLRPTEITGFLGITQMPFVDRIVARRQRNFAAFKKAIAGKFEKIYNLYQNEGITVNSNFAFPIVFRSKELFEQYKAHFTKKGIEIRPIIGGNLVAQPFYKPYHKYKVSIKNTKEICSQGFYFGNNPDLTRAELDYITSILSNI